MRLAAAALVVLVVGGLVACAPPESNDAAEKTSSGVNSSEDPTVPDVFDLGQTVALANTVIFAPYRVAKFDEISDASKAPDGAKKYLEANWAKAIG